MPIGRAVCEAVPSALACAVVGVALAACGGADAGWDGPTITQRVTTGFGRELVGAEDAAPLRPPRTVLGALRDHEEVELSETGRSLVEIDGRRRGEHGDDETAWALNVNGIEADVEPSEYRLHPGDVVQWDLRDWYVTLDVRATVGAFPQTFTRGMFGRRFPVTVRCAAPDSAPCRTVESRLRRAGVATDGSRPPGWRPPDPDPPARPVLRARVLVGQWRHWRDLPAPRRIEQGPRHSGIFARFTRDGERLRLLDWNDEVVRTAGAGAGLVGAIRPTAADLVWIVTGVDEQGVRRAASAFNSADLRDAFAVVVAGDSVEKIPLPPSG